MAFYIKILLFVSFLFGFSQYRNNEYWNKFTTIKFDEQIQQVEHYFDTINKDKKGSGYKPFKRWEYRWQNSLDDYGNVLAPEYYSNFIKQLSSNTISRNSIQSNNWEPIGPSSLTNTGSWSTGRGRINTVEIHPTNNNVVFVGTPSGGLWKTIDGGQNWLPLTDFLPQIGVAGIALDYTNSNVVYISTGDRDNWDTYSTGIYKSIDGGVTWAPTGLTFGGTTWRCGDIVMHPTLNNVLYVATNGGIFKTEDAGNNWALVQVGDFAPGSIRFKPNDNSVIYACSTTQFFKSTNQGDTFVPISSVAISGVTFGRILLDVTPANPNVVYALAVKNNYLNSYLFKSIDSGDNFSNSTPPSNILETSQAWYDLALTVSDIDENTIFTGCLNIWKSSNSGVSYTKLNNWNEPNSGTYTHADIHYLKMKNGVIYCASDGGLYKSSNYGLSFSDITGNMQIGQFYKIAVAKNNSSKMHGGLQDNGGQGLSNGMWKNFYGADGMDTLISQTNSNLYCGFTQFGGRLYFSQNAGQNLSQGISNPLGQIGGWVTPLVGNSKGEIYAGFKELFKLVNLNWVRINGNTFNTDIDLIEIDPNNETVFYVVINEQLYKSTNSGITFFPIYTAANTITGIEVQNGNSNIIYLTTGNVSGLILKSIDGGIIFNPYGANQPAIPKKCIVHQARNNNNPIFIGTDVGVYYIDDTLTNWVAYSANLPKVPITDLEINLEDGKLIASTYGRGVWQTDIAVQLATTDIGLYTIEMPNTTINCNSDIVPEVKIKNNGLSLITSVDFSYSVDSGTLLNYTWNGTISQGQIQTISLPILSNTKGTHTLAITATTNNDAYSDNNSNSTLFYINDAGTIGLTNPFTNPSDELITISSNGNNWIRGNRTDALNTNGNTAYLSNLDGNYAKDTILYLVSSCYNLTQVSNPFIEFKMKFDLENNWDIAYVEYSTNNGLNWNLLGQKDIDWYNSDRTPYTSGTDCFNCVGGQWTGANTFLTTYFYPLNAFSSETNIMFRIVFFSDGGVEQLGVVVDDFVVNGTLSQDQWKSSLFKIFPNPSTSYLNIFSSSNDDGVVIVHDMLGKKIIENKILAHSTSTLDTASWQTGIYTISIVTNSENQQQMIIKN